MFFEFSAKKPPRQGLFGNRRRGGRGGKGKDVVSCAIGIGGSKRRGGGMWRREDEVCRVSSTKGRRLMPYTVRCEEVDWISHFHCLPFWLRDEVGCRALVGFAGGGFFPTVERYWQLGDNCRRQCRSWVCGERVGRGREEREGSWRTFFVRLSSRWIGRFVYWRVWGWSGRELLGFGVGSCSVSFFSNNSEFLLNMRENVQRSEPRGQCAKLFQSTWRGGL